MKPIDNDNKIDMFCNYDDGTMTQIFSIELFWIQEVGTESMEVQPTVRSTWSKIAACSELMNYCQLSEDIVMQDCGNL